MLLAHIIKLEEFLPFPFLSFHRLSHSILFLHHLHSREASTLMPRFPIRPVRDACLEALERQYDKQNIWKRRPSGRYVRRLKSHCVGLLLRKENGKCSTAKHCAEFPNIGSHSPEHKWTCSGLDRMLRHFLFHAWRRLRRLLPGVLYAESFCLRSLHSLSSLRSLRCSHSSHPSDRIIPLLMRTVLRSSGCSDSPVHLSDLCLRRRGLCPRFARMRYRLPLQDKTDNEFRWAKRKTSTEVKMKPSFPHRIRPNPKPCLWSISKEQKKRNKGWL